MDEYKNNALMFKALSDENRLRIISLIKNGETCSCVLLEDLTICQSTLSHHMKILIDSKLVVSRKEGKYTMYALSTDKIKQSINYLDDMLKIDETDQPQSGKVSDRCK